MAARLIQRSSRLLAASVSLQPLSSSVPLEHVRSLLPRRALHSSPLWACAKVLPGDSLSRETQSEDDFKALLRAMPGVEELLKISSEREINGNRGVMILQQICRREEANKVAVLSDPRFHELLEVVNSQIQYVWNGHIIKLLQSLYQLGLSSKSHYLQSVETEVRWRIRRFNIGALAQLSSYLFPMALAKEEKCLLDDVVKQVELRWMEIKEPKTLVTLISKLGFLSSTLMEKLEDKVLEFADKLTPEQSLKVILVLATQNRRTLPVLRALAFHLAQSDKAFPVSFILDLAYAYAKLNFCQFQVLQKMATDIVPKLPELSSMEITNLFRSFSSLKCSNLHLCDAIAQAFIDRSDEFTTTQLCSLIHSFAHLNFQPVQSEEFFNVVHRCLVSQLDTMGPDMLLDLVWSLCILTNVTAPYFRKVLEPQFYTQVLGRLNENSPKYVSCSLKLLHINATAQLESADYQGPLLPDDVMQKLLCNTQGSHPSTLQNSVGAMLKKLFPEPGTCNFNVQTVYGWSIDGELVLDSGTKALVMKDLVAPHSLQSEGTNPLPEGAKRFAILTQDYSNYCFRSKDLLGRYVMNKRHLQAAGFLVVEVPFYDWQEIKSEWQKQTFLRDQIKKVEAKEMAR